MNNLQTIKSYHTILETEKPMTNIPQEVSSWPVLRDDAFFMSLCVKVQTRSLRPPLVGNNPDNKDTAFQTSSSPQIPLSSYHDGLSFNV